MHEVAERLARPTLTRRRAEEDQRLGQGREVKASSSRAGCSCVERVEDGCRPPRARSRRRRRAVAGRCRPREPRAHDGLGRLGALRMAGHRGKEVVAIERVQDAFVRAVTVAVRATSRRSAISPK